MKKGIILILIGLICPVMIVVKNVQFNQECKGYLRQCSNASSVELALERLDLAIRYVERNDLTSGYTSILWKTESDNIGYWYDNLMTCRKELKKAVNSSQLEQTNTLLKIRESLTENGEKGEYIVLPEGIVKYPHNLLYAILLWVSLGFILIGACYCIIED